LSGKVICLEQSADDTANDHLLLIKIQNGSILLVPTNPKEVVIAVVL